MKTNCIILIWALILLVGCSTSYTTTYWKSENKPEQDIERILVVGISANERNRSLVEREVSYMLNSNKIKAAPSVTYVNAQRRKPTKEEILPLIDSLNVHAVLTMELIEVKEGDPRYQLQSGASYYGPENPNFYNYLDGFTGSGKQGYFTAEQFIVMETNLYDASNGKVIFSAFSETFAPTAETLEPLVEDFAQSVAKKLRKSGLIVLQK